jgi:ABC-type phosphate/phosphonate transport system substrate-binding protein
MGKTSTRSKNEKFIVLKKSFEYFVEKLFVPLAIVAGTYVVTNTVENVPKTAVILATTKYSIATPDSQELQLKAVITDRANKLLGNINKKYEFIPTVMAGNYGELVKGLLFDRVDIAFFAPYLYTQGVMDKDSDVYNHFRLVGFKYTSSGEWYYSGIVISKDQGISNLEQFKNAFSKNEKSKKPIFIFGKDPSASTMAIPQLFLLQNNISIDSVEKIGRVDMMHKLQKADGKNYCYIGFLSSEDWEEAKKQNPGISDKFEFIKINNFPIPDDPVFVNKDKWDQRFNKKGLFFWKQTDGDLILQSLRYWVYTNIDKSDGLDNRWIDNNKEFIKLIYSGTITKINYDTLTIRFVNDDNHIKMLKQLNKSGKKILISIGNFDHTEKDTEINFKYPNFFEDKRSGYASVIGEINSNILIVTVDTILISSANNNKSVLIKDWN